MFVAALYETGLLVGLCNDRDGTVKTFLTHREVKRFVAAKNDTRQDSETTYRAMRLEPVV